MFLKVSEMHIPKAAPRETEQKLGDSLYAVNNDTKTVQDASADLQKSEFQAVLDEMYIFKHQYPIEKRKIWSAEAFQRYPEKIPLIIEKHYKCSDIEDL